MYEYHLQILNEKLAFSFLLFINLEKKLETRNTKQKTNDNQQYCSSINIIIWRTVKKVVANVSDSFNKLIFIYSKTWLNMVLHFIKRFCITIS